MISSLFTVIVNWNLKEDTLACVHSLLAAGAVPGTLIVVDNGSTDGSTQALRDRFPSALDLVESDRNLGFAGGSNLGIRRALERGAAWVLLVNNDTLFAPTFFAELTRAMEADLSNAILGPLILYHGDPDRIWYLGDRLIPGLLATHSLYREEAGARDWPVLLPVDFVTGCGMLIRRDVFDAVGLLDERLFMYGEDVDLCWRARQAGFLIAAAPRAKMWHKVSVSSERDRPAARYFRIRNQIRFYRSSSRPWQLPLMVGFTGIRALRLAAGDLRRGQRSLLGPLAAGWLAGWLNRPDPREYIQTWNT